MGDFEAEIDKQNKKAVEDAIAAEKAAKAADRAEKFEQAVDKVKTVVLTPFEKIKAGIEAAKEARVQKELAAQKEAEFQNTCNEQYQAYVAKAEESDALIGTVEAKTGENGEQIEITYTERGPIVKTTTVEPNHHGWETKFTRYEGMAPLQVNGVEQLVYVNARYSAYGTKDYDFENYDGIIRDPKGTFKSDSTTIRDGYSYNGPHDLTLAYDYLKATHTAVCEAAATTTELPPEA